MRRVVCVCVCLSTFTGSMTSVWATDLALPPLRPPPPLPPTEVFAYRWSGCYAGANAGIAWSRQQQTWSGNAAAAPVQAAAPAPVQVPAANPPAANPPVANPPIVAQPAPPPVNNPPPGNGGWKPPYKPPVYGHHDHDKDWWAHGKPDHDDNYKDHKWAEYGEHHKHDHDADHDWPQIGSKDGTSRHGDHDWTWAGQHADDKYGHEKPDGDKYDFGKYDFGKYGHDEHGTYAKQEGTGWFEKASYDDHDKHGGGWSQLHSNGYSDRYAWLRHDRDDDHDKQASWLKQAHDGDHDKGAWGWQQQPSYVKYDAAKYAYARYDKDDRKDRDDKYVWHDGKHDHGGYVWQPVPPKPGWPANNPPPNNGGGQPPKQNPPPVQGNNGGAQPPQQNPAPVQGAVAPLPASVLLQTPTTVSSNGSDAAGGLQLGCDTQLDRFVIGIQAMADIGIINASNAIAPGLTTNAATRNLYTATVRAGYLVTPEILAYVRGGAAWTRTSVSIVNTATGQSAMGAFNRTGWTVGAGVEWMFARNWTAFAEYDYADFGTATGTLPGAAAVTGGPNVVSLKTQVHTALLGVNYRFEMLNLPGR